MPAVRRPRPLVAWISPHDPLHDVPDVVDLAHRVCLSGYETRVALPTAYGLYLQGEMERPRYRAIGDALAPASVEGLRALREAIEAHGVPCEGWSVPRGTVDPEREGSLHGQVAAVFDRFVLNLECGWEGFWSRPDDPEAANAFLGAFWRAIEDAGRAADLDGNVGCTWVVGAQAGGQLGAMPASMSDDSKRAWLLGTNWDALEVYGPGGSYDGSLDPARDLPAWRAELRRLGFRRRRVEPMVAPPNPLRAQIRRWGRRGAHLWTLHSAATVWSL